MAKNIGILIDSEHDGNAWGDILVDRLEEGATRRSGGMEIGEITAQNQAFILAAHKGEFKEEPTIGVGISDMVLDHNELLWKQRIRVQLEQEGMNVSAIELTDKELHIHAKYS